MVSIIANGKIRTGMLCLSMFLSCVLPSYGATIQQSNTQSVNAERAKPLPMTPAVNAPKDDNIRNDAKKKKLKEGVKDTHVGPPPINAPPKKKIIKPSSTLHRNPIDISTGRELTPAENISSQTPIVK